MKFSFLIISLLLWSFRPIAQSFLGSNAWRNNRVELTGGIGASNFLGDLGGRDRVASKFYLDMELVKTRYVAQFTYLYYIQRTIAIRPSFHFARVTGDDALTQEYYRHHRNLNFKSNLYEFSVTGEYQFIKEKQGNRYGIKSPTGRKLGLKGKGIGMYLTAGVGVVFFNPKRIGSGASLRKMGTEGQGLPAGGQKYKRATIVIPFGLGFRKALGPNSGLKFEFSHRYTFSDYLDDVSTNYYNNDAIRTVRGDAAAAAADSHILDGLENTSHGLQRGDPKDKDSYMFLTISYFKRIPTVSKRKKR